MTYRSVVVTQPYVPSYRRPLFAELKRQLREDLNADLTVVAGTPSGEQALRGDLIDAASWQSEPRRRLAFGPVELRTLPRLTRDTVLVSELSGLNLTPWAHFGRRPVVLWGHGRSFVNEPSRVTDQLKRLLARRADYVMTYSERGREYVTSTYGLRPSRVRAIGNSTDTKELRTAVLASLPMAPVPRPDAPRILYIGGLDASKRIPFILDAFRELVRLHPDSRLRVVGRGALAGLVEDFAQNMPQVQYVPEARGAELAALGADSDFLWVPGRVGLIAVDGLALGLPLMTTDFEFHAPERDFLGPGDVYVLPDSPQEFARDTALRATQLLQHERRFRTDIPSVEGVAAEFVASVADAIEHFDRRAEQP